MTKKMTRAGYAALVKISMTTSGSKIGRDEEFTVMKVQAFVNFQDDEENAKSQFERQIARKVEYYEGIFDIKVEKHSFEYLYIDEVEFTSYPKALLERKKRVHDAQKM